MIGPPLLAAAIERGWKIALLNRNSPPPPSLRHAIEHVQGDRSDEAVVGQLAAFAPDVVIDLSCYEPEHVELSLAMLAPVTDRYLLMSSGAVYAPSDLLPWNESSPVGPNELWGSYGAKKLQNERIAAGFAATTTVVALRAPYLVGQPDFMGRLQFVADRIAHDGIVYVTDSGNAPVHLVAPSDVAGALLHLAEAEPDSPAPSGLFAYNIANRQAVTLAGLVRLLAAAMERPAPSVVPVPLSTVGLSDRPFSWTDMVFPFADEPFLLDDAKLRASGFTPGYDLVRLLSDFADRYQAAGGPFAPTRFPAENAIRQLPSHA